MRARLADVLLPFRSKSKSRRAATHVALAPQALEARVCMDTTGLPLAVNLAPVRANDRERVFVDVFKNHSPWITQFTGDAGVWNTGGNVKVDANGVISLDPGEALGTRMLASQDGHFPGGTYVMTYAGDGDFAFGMDATVSSVSDHRIELEVTPGNKGIYMRVDRSNPLDPVHDIHVWMPGFENAASPFHPDFLEGLKIFGALRFMDWQKTNNSPLENWSDRTLPTASTQVSQNGVAVEYMVELANELNENPWFTMPHLANDDYVRNFAQIVHDQLEPDRKIYVEWSNEAWNANFAQGEWARNQASLRFGGRGDYAKVIADEDARVWAIWREVFADDPTRVIRVAAGQLGGPQVVAQMAERLNGEFDAIAPAAYFQARDRKLDENTSAEDLLRSGFNDIEKRLMPLMAAHKAIVDGWEQRTGRDLLFITYEGGQHFTARGLDVPWQQAMWDAQVDPLMYEAYRRVLVKSAELGLDMFTAYSYVTANTKYGSWGAKQYQDQPASEAPKWQALLDAASGSLLVDNVAPTASLVNSVDVRLRTTGSRIVIHYDDDAGVDVGTLGKDDLQVIGPKKNRLDVTFVSWQVGKNGGIDAAYRVSAPGKNWNKPDNGIYSICVGLDPVEDIHGNNVQPAKLGTFRVLLSEV